MQREKIQYHNYTDGKNASFVTFDGWSDLRAFIADPDAPHAASNRPRLDDVRARIESTGGRRRDFFGGTTGPEADGFVRNGWPEGADRVRELADTLAPASPPTSLRRRRVRSDHGDDLDIHSVYAGALDTAWTRRARVSHRAPRVIELLLPIGGHWQRSADELFWTAASGLACTHSLEAAGYRVGIRFYHVITTPRDHYHMYTIRAKRPESPLDLSALAVGACAGVFRRHCFAGNAAGFHAIGPSYGTPVHSTHTTRAMIEAAGHNTRGLHIVPASWTEADAQRVAATTLATLTQANAA